MPSKKSLFIHSLFRSGSTYFFNVFRRSKRKYLCYQEPLHEETFFLKNDPESLDKKKNFKELRHPEIGKSYFYELSQAWPRWRNFIKEHDIYDNFFTQTQKIDPLFWKSLIDPSKRKNTVFQETRTFGRMSFLKKKIDAYNIFLWRNPWDQWWSYKINSYFDQVNQIILFSNNTPVILKILREKYFPKYNIPRGLKSKFKFFESNPPSPEQSYLIFYLFWCLSLQEANKYCEIVINIDELSRSVKYRLDTEKKLNFLGYGDLSFDDCNMPFYPYNSSEEKFFKPLERVIHKLLMKYKFTESDIKEINNLKDKYNPRLKNKDLYKHLKKYTSTQDYLSSLRKSLIDHETTRATLVSENNLLKKKLNDIENSKTMKFIKKIKFF